MSGESLGTARLDLTVDIRDFAAQITKAKSLADGLGNSAEQAFAQATGRSKTAADSLLRYVNNLGMSVDQTRLLTAAIKGVNPEIINAAAAAIGSYRDGVQAATLAEQNKAAIQEEASRRTIAALDAETAAVARGQAAVTAAQAQQARLEQMRLDAASAFGPQLQAQELAAAGAAREAGVRERLAALMNSERGQRLAVSQSYETEARAIALGGAAAAKSGIQFNQYGLSAKQTAAALRQVPAQMTDIIVSLQSGQAPLTVLLQQGGQLKDVFGGAVPAAKALGAQMLRLATNPYVVLTAAAVGLTAAFFEGEKETNALAEAVILAGNQAGVSAGQLQQMSEQLSDINTTQHEAAQALAAVVQSGKFTAAQYEMVTRAAINMQRATGQAIDKTIEQFASLAQDPTKNVVELNNQIHFLTETTYKQIAALQQQGDEQGAAALAMKTYADEMTRRTDEIGEHLGTLQSVARDVGWGFKWMWDRILDVGRDKTLDEEITDISSKIATLKDDSNFAPSATGHEDRAKQILQLRAELQTKLRQQEAGYRDDDKKAATQRLEDYKISVDQELVAHGTAADKLVAAIKAARGRERKAEADAVAAGTATPEHIKALRDQEALLEKTLTAEHAKKGDGGLANAQSKADLAAFKDQLEQEEAAITASRSVLEAQYSAKLISVKDYYAGLHDLMDRDQAAQEKALTGQIAALKTRNVTGKDAVNVSKELADLEAKLAVLRIKDASAQQILTIQEKAANDERAAALEQFKHSLDETIVARQLEINAAIAAIGMGQREAAHLQEIARIREDGAKQLRDLALLQNTQYKNDQEGYRERVAAQQKATDELVRIAQDGYKRTLQAQGSWLNGVSAGIQDWMEQTADVYSQIRDMTTHDLDTMADALTNFAETGKFEWRSMLIDMLKELEKFLVKQALLKAAYAFVSYLGNSYGFQGGTDASTFAKGDVFTSPSLSQYSNGVYDQPTLFQFAKGAGVFGEAGPEAIMPLSRGSDGKLGVKASGGGDVQIIVSTTINSDGSSKTDTKSSKDQSAAFRQFTDQMAVIAQEQIRKEMRPGGKLWQAGVTAS